MTISSINQSSALSSLLANYATTNLSTASTTADTQQASDTSSISDFASLLSSSTTSLEDLIAQRKELLTQKNSATTDDTIALIQAQLDSINEQLAEALSSYDTSSTYNYSSTTDATDLWSTSTSDSDSDSLTNSFMQIINVGVLQALGKAQQQLSTRANSLQATVEADSTNTTAASALQNVQQDLSLINTQYNSLLSSTTNSSTSSNNLWSSLTSSSALKQYETEQKVSSI